IGSFGGSTNNGDVHALYNLSGGTVTASGTAGAVRSNVAPYAAGDDGSVFAGEGSNGILSVSGSGQLIAGRVRVARTAPLGMINLMSGGTITATSVTNGTGTGLLNFNGGTLQAIASDGGAPGSFFLEQNFNPDPAVNPDPSNPAVFVGTFRVYSYSGGA